MSPHIEQSPSQPFGPIADPVDSRDAATKRYVDSQTGGGGVAWFNVVSSLYGAVADNATDCYAAIKAAADAAAAAGGGVVYLPAGKYRISQALPAYSHVSYVGDGVYVTELRSMTAGVGQTITGGAMFSGVDTEWFGIQDMAIYGVGKSGTNCSGLRLDLASGTVNRHVNLNRVRFQDLAGDGIYVNNPIMCKFDNVRVVNATGDGMLLDTGTSTNVLECYMGGCDKAGFHMKAMTYANLLACASESNGVSYEWENTSNCVALACGAEVSSDISASYPGTHFRVVGGVCNEFISCYAREFNTGANSGLKAYIDVSGSGASATFSNFRGTASSVAPANTYRIGTGAVVHLRSYTFGGLAGGGPSGTLVIDEGPNSYQLMPANGTTTLAINRGANTNFSNFSFFTGRVLQWTIGSRSDSTEDFHFRDNINGRSLLLLKQTVNRVGLANQTSPTSTVHVGGSLATAFRSVSGTYTVVEADSLVVGDATSAAFTITLPTATGCPGRVYTFKRINGAANNITIAAAAGETIDSAASKVLGAAQSAIQLVSNGGTNWHIVSQLGTVT